MAATYKNTFKKQESNATFVDLVHFPVRRVLMQRSGGQRVDESETPPALAV